MRTAVGFTASLLLHAAIAWVALTPSPRGTAPAPPQPAEVPRARAATATSSTSAGDAADAGAAATARAEGARYARTFRAAREAAWNRLSGSHATVEAGRADAVDWTALGERAAAGDDAALALLIAGADDCAAPELGAPPPDPAAPLADRAAADPELRALADADAAFVRAATESFAASAPPTCTGAPGSGADDLALALRHAGERRLGATPAPPDAANDLARLRQLLPEPPRWVPTREPDRVARLLAEGPVPVLVSPAADPRREDPGLVAAIAACLLRGCGPFAPPPATDALRAAWMAHAASFGLPEAIEAHVRALEDEGRMSDAYAWSEFARWTAARGCAPDLDLAAVAARARARAERLAALPPSARADARARARALIALHGERARLALGCD